MLDDLGLVDMLLPELASLKGLEQSKNTIYTTLTSIQSKRLSALLRD